MNNITSQIDAVFVSEVWLKSLGHCTHLSPQPRLLRKICCSVKPNSSSI